MKSLKKLALLVAMTLTSAVTAMAQPKHLEPGSALLYPLFDSSPGAGTLLCVTNINDSRLYCDDTDTRAGDVALHYQYIAEETCFEFDVFEFLTPGDTLCVLADLHNPEGERGFLLVSAVDPNDLSKKIDFDYLLGSAIIVQSGLNFLWGYTPYVFEGNPNSMDPSACSRTATDADNDGALDFDGREYNTFPKELFIDSFFEEVSTFSNSLTLLTTTGSDYVAHLDFLFWNNIEQKFSRSFEFSCWWQGALSDISAIVKDLGGDRKELGFNNVETGWASIRGRRVTDLAGNRVENESGRDTIPPILGVFVQFISTTDFAAGHALHYNGTLDGLELLIGDRDPQREIY